VGEFVEYVGNDWPEGEFKPLAVQPDVIDVGGGQFRVVLKDGAVGTRAIFWQEFAHYAALQTAYTTAAGRQAGDAATTDCPLEYVAWGTLRNLYPGQFEREWQAAHREFGVRKYVRIKHEYDRAVYA